MSNWANVAKCNVLPYCFIAVATLQSKNGRAARKCIVGVLWMVLSITTLYRLRVPYIESFTTKRTERVFFFNFARKIPVLWNFRKFKLFIEISQKMSKLKSLMPNLFGGNKESHINTNANASSNADGDAVTDVVGRLESDALPVEDQDQDNNSGALSLPSNTPTASADLTESVLRELSDPNYNSMEVVHSAQIPGGALVNSSNSNNTMNTMNVHSAQQQVVMNFSNASNLHFGSVYNFNQNLSACSSRKGSTSATEELASPTDGKRHLPRKTVSIVTMMQSQDEPDPRILDTVATHLGEGWKQVMRDLGHSEGQIEQAIIDHQMHGNIKEVICCTFLQFKSVVKHFACRWSTSCCSNGCAVPMMALLQWADSQHCYGNHNIGNACSAWNSYGRLSRSARHRVSQLGLIPDCFNWHSIRAFINCESVIC